MPEPGFPENRSAAPRIVVFDTAGPHVAVGWADGADTGGDVQDMARGQAETLMPTLEEMIAARGWAWSDVDAIGVGVGPGNFTGIRIAVSAARGLGVALGIPVFGISGFDSAAPSYPVPDNTIIALPAPRDHAYLRGFASGNALLDGNGMLIDPAALPGDLTLAPGGTVIGHRAEEIARHLGRRTGPAKLKPDPATLAALTAQLYHAATTFPPRPVPDYIKPADAAPARDLPPVLLS